jgi:hypothetical protein
LIKHRHIRIIPQKQPQPKSDEEKHQATEQRAVRNGQREACCPYHQFIYQVSKERERILEEPANWEGAGTTNINTRTYENVKDIWAKRMIWNITWGVIPGMVWKHEEPLEEQAIDDYF